MQWSRLKQQIKERIAPVLADRIDFHSTGYRWHHEADGRIWFTLDGAEIVNFCSQTHWNQKNELVEELLECRAVALNDEGSRAEALDRAEVILRQQGLLTRDQARGDLEEYLGLSVEEGLASGSPLQIGIAVLDRRLGKRRLRNLELPAGLPSFVTELLEVRLRAEGLDRARERKSDRGAEPAE